MSTPRQGPTSADAARFRSTRAFSRRLVAPLHPEDCVIQSMPDVSPMRWHLAHTTWFFETFVLGPQPGYSPFRAEFCHLFNSYYDSVGEPFPRARRGLLSRPTVAEVLEYRDHVDALLGERLEHGRCTDAERAVVELGLQHEQQHQELMLTDIKHVLSCNPLRPVYAEDAMPAPPAGSPAWVEFPEGLREIGHQGTGFHFDNERPRHQRLVPSFALRSHPVTCAEYLEFIADRGYQRPELWLSLGMDQVRREGWRAPLYWFEQGGEWMQFTLAGAQPIAPHAPVCHVSLFEADAFARWAGHRLPTEAEWEVAAETCPPGGAFAEDLLQARQTIHPGGPASPGALQRMYGDVWEWTSSQYEAYPGYRPPPGALGEYNGKFMCNQFVLRGGSCASPQRSHLRATYRNFFPPEARWQFTGLRLAR